MFLRRPILVTLLLLFCKQLFSQGTGEADERDTAMNKLAEVTIRAYFHEQPLLSSPASASVISLKQLNNFSGASLVPALNTVAGVRMEERSPGSYRLSIRGSLLRSPFGIRNVKVYFDEFALTDAGGNTYLNLVDVSALNRVEILKGPEGSIFGANTGGVVLLGRADAGEQDLSAGLSGGSYGFFHEHLALGTGNTNYKVRVSQAYQRAAGYRENSAHERQFYSVSQRLKYSRSSGLRSTILFSDLQYQTPGGLTLVQSQLNPRSARPASGKIPGAREQLAGIYNQTIFGGLLNETHLNNKIKMVAALSGIHTNFKNPFITNFEVRRENSVNLRAFGEYRLAGAVTELNIIAGLEAQQTASAIRNYGNRGGARDTMQTADKLTATQDFAFTRFTTPLNRRLIMEAAVSLNFYSYRYSRSYPAVVSSKKKSFDDQLMPRFALSWLISPALAVRATASKGYSAPTIAEVRASDNTVNTALQPEKGWNYETGVRFSSRLIYFDASVFSFRLEDAIVRRVNASDAEYFINAGGTTQRGFESTVIAWLRPPRESGWLRSVQLSNAATLNRFSFKNYLNGILDYSGNKLTGVPAQTLITGISSVFPGALQVFIQHSYSSSIPLNDANSAYSVPYHIFQIRAGKAFSLKKSPYRLTCYLGSDNVFDKRYSLGNDLNAAGGRYFNPSAGRNYYAGITIGK